MLSQWSSDSSPAPERDPLVWEVTGASQKGPRLWPLLAFSLLFGLSGAFMVWAGAIGPGVIVLGCGLGMMFLFGKGIIDAQGEKRGRTRRTKRSTPTQPRPQISTTQIVVVLLTGAAFVGFALLGAPDAWKAAQSRGVAGTFVAEQQDCDKYRCEWEGAFESDDGQTRLPAVSFDGDLNSDGRATAIATSGHARVYPPGSWTEFGWVVFSFVWGVALLLLGGAMPRLRAAARQGQPSEP